MTTTFATAMRAVPIVFYGVVSISSLWLAGCAGPGFLNMGAETPAFKNPAVSIQNAGNAIVVGKTSKAEILAALGAAEVINFDSGFEVWVYRVGSRAPAQTKQEFVILFTPDGVVKKTRLQPAYPVQN